jgi:hypothetical protein
MPKSERINLHAIDREIREVQKKLETAFKSATVYELTRLKQLLKKLEAVREKCHNICPKVWTVWPIYEAEAARKVKKPRRKKKGPGSSR